MFKLFAVVIVWYHRVPTFNEKTFSMSTRRMRNFCLHAFLGLLLGLLYFQE